MTLYTLSLFISCYCFSVRWCSRLATGSTEDYEAALVAGATAKGADAMGTCVNTQLKRANVTSFDKATPGQVDAAVLKCEASAEQAFEKAGGVRHCIVNLSTSLQRRGATCLQNRRQNA